MKSLLKFVEEYTFGIFLVITFSFLIIFLFILSIQGIKSDFFDLEERCFSFYKENNYILEECYKYSDKLKGE